MDRSLTPDRQTGKLKSNLQRDMCLALVSHELRTPTNAIIGWTRLIKDGCADESTLAHAIDVIERNARFQAELIEQLLEFSRVSNGLLRLDAQICEYSARAPPSTRGDNSKRYRARYLCRFSFPRFRALRTGGRE
jgi:signal transduction histidine kinase